MIKYIICIVLIALWYNILNVLKRAELHFWRFIAGSFGLFIFLMILARPVLSQPLAKAVASISGLFGNLTDTFSAYFKYGILFIESAAGAITLQVDFECSGIIEIMAFISLLAFFMVYTVNERIVIGVLGTIYIILANVLRVTVICLIIHFFGPDAYFISHTIIGRLIFYTFSVMLYFYVFTKPQIIRMKIGKFTYGHS